MVLLYFSLLLCIQSLILRCKLIIEYISTLYMTGYRFLVFKAHNHVCEVYTFVSKYEETLCVTLIQPKGFFLFQERKPCLKKTLFVQQVFSGAAKREHALETPAAKLKLTDSSNSMLLQSAKRSQMAHSVTGIQHSTAIHINMSGE